MDVKNDLSGGKPTLLIAEDEESNYLLLKTILHKYCNLIRAKTGLEALALFKENEVDLILMDIKMPVMDGYDAARSIRQSKHEDAGRIPILAMTANAFREDEEDALAAGMNGHIAKPIDVDALYRTMSELLR